MDDPIDYGRAGGSVMPITLLLERCTWPLAYAENRYGQPPTTYHIAPLGFLVGSVK